MKTLIVQHQLTIAGVMVGAVCGYLYYIWVGCTSGSCPITSQPINSSIYGAVMGALVFRSFKKEKVENEK